MGIEFYTLDLSPYCRGAWMTLEALNLKYTKKITNIFQGQHKTDAYAEISPRQTIPGLKDGTVVLGESKAIACYLCNAYGEKMSKTTLYPAEPKSRARVDMVLYMSESFADKLYSYVNIFGVLQKGEKTKTEEVGKVHEVLTVIEKLLTKSKYVAADHLTIADFFVYIAEGMLSITEFKDYAKYPKLTAWKQKMSQLPCHKKTCEEPLAQFSGMYKAKLQEAASKKF